MALYLPRNVGALSKLAPKENSRFPSMRGVRVMDLGDDQFRLDITDGKVLAVVRGHCAAPQARCVVVDYPPLADAPNGADVLVVPREVWEQAFDLARKDKFLRDFPVGVSLGTEALTFAVREHSFTAPPLEGRYPDTDSIIPKTPPLVTFAIDPAYMIKVCQAAQAIMGDESKALTIAYFGPGKPLGALCKDEKGVFADFLLMPLDNDQFKIQREREERERARIEKDEPWSVDLDHLDVDEWPNQLGWNVGPHDIVKMPGAGGVVRVHAQVGAEEWKTLDLHLGDFSNLDPVSAVRQCIAEGRTMTDEDEQASEQAVEEMDWNGRFLSILKVSADTPEKFRAVDVDRVMGNAEHAGILEEFRTWLLTKPIKDKVAKRVREWKPEAQNGHAH